MIDEHNKNDLVEELEGELKEMCQEIQQDEVSYWRSFRRTVHRMIYGTSNKQHLKKRPWKNY